MSLNTSALVCASLMLMAAAAVVKPASSRAAFLGVNASRAATYTYGNPKCPCVGVANLKGYFSLSYGDGIYMQYPIDVGSQCTAWEKNRDHHCKGVNSPAWCAQEWCYVDPCKCDLDILPKVTHTGVEFQGSPAYYSYNTCGAKDSWSTSGEVKKKTCIGQKTKNDCRKLSKCAWDGQQCSGKELVHACKKASALDQSIHGKEDCRCIGHYGKNGEARLSINSTHEAGYSADVGGTCKAWEETAHPACNKKGGKKPSWCSQKWCYVDPCKCKTKSSPKEVMPSNSYQRFQGMVAHWSYETCGSVDSWSSAGHSKYCTSQKTAQQCNKVGKCSWAGKECVSQEIAKVCAGAKSSATRLGLGLVVLMSLGAFAMH